MFDRQHQSLRVPIIPAFWIAAESFHRLEHFRSETKVVNFRRGVVLCL